MKLSIIVPDKMVVIDGIVHEGLDVSSLPPEVRAIQWNENFGEVEFFRDANGDHAPNAIINSLEIPAIQAVITKWNEAHTAAMTPPVLTSEDLIALCKRQAKDLLVDSDWTQQADVRQTLLNAKEFDAYRAVLRSLTLEPVEAPTWPTAPIPVWK